MTAFRSVYCACTTTSRDITRSAVLADEKGLNVRLGVVTQITSVTDRQTDGGADTHLIRIKK